MIQDDFGVNEGVTHFGFGRLLVGFGSSNSAASDTPSTSGGAGSPASVTMVGYKSTDSTSRFETMPPFLDGSRMMMGTRVPSSKLL